MGSEDAVTFVATDKVGEDSTAIIEFDLEDAANEMVPLTNISSATLELTVEKTQAVIRASFDVKPNYDVDGHFYYVVPFGDNTIQSTATPKPTTEDHIAKIITSFTVAGVPQRKTRNYRLTIKDNTAVPLP